MMNIARDEVEVTNVPDTHVGNLRNISIYQWNHTTWAYVGGYPKYALRVQKSAKKERLSHNLDIVNGSCTIQFADFVKSECL
jgi:hypothetical protein